MTAKALQDDMGKVMIPDLLRSTPRARPVLDRYGLRGCGGPMGPVESLEFFAKAHDVALPQLLQEIRAALAQPEAVAVGPASSNQDALADGIYRPFFKAGIVTVLTAGAVWGAYLLLRIGFARSFTTAGLHDVNAHGHAQIFGWVGLFVMGFAYQAFPRFKHTSLSQPRLALTSLALMLTGLLVRSICEPLSSGLDGMGVLAVNAAVLEVIGVGLFVCIILHTFATAGKQWAAYDYYIVCALGWFLVQAVYEAIYLAATVSVTDPEKLLQLVSTWQGPLREIQVHGFAMLMIFGVSQRIFPHFYGLSSPSSRKAFAALLAVNVAIVGEVVGLFLMRTEAHVWAVLWYGCVLLLTGTVIALVWSWHIFAATAESDRSLKFLRAGYIWLFVSLVMLSLLPVYQYGLLRIVAPESSAAHLGFSHAYYGAVRHAVTVGFISLMIVGVAAKVVPTLNGVDVRLLSPLWGPFLLINTGCALRVVTQISTDFTELAFRITPLSGLLEVSGLALWGIHLWRIMDGKARIRSAPPLDASAYASVVPGEPVVEKHRVGDVLDHYPELLTVFLEFGFKPLANPLLRRTLARQTTIEKGCRLLGIDAAVLTEALNAKLREQSSRRLALPMAASASHAPHSQTGTDW